MLAEHGGRSVRIRALPIGIPFAHFESLAESSPKDSFSNNSIQVILGVDRLDYTKGKHSDIYSRVNKLYFCSFQYCVCIRCLLRSNYFISRFNKSLASIRETFGGTPRIHRKYTTNANCGSLED